MSDWKWVDIADNKREVLRIGDKVRYVCGCEGVINEISMGDEDETHLVIRRTEIVCDGEDEKGDIEYDVNSVIIECVIEIDQQRAAWLNFVKEQANE